mgnify:FL=1
MSMLCTICARSGSKGLKNKNFLKINGKTLISRCISQALKIKKITNVVVSSDAKKFRKISNKKIFYINRPKKLSSDRSGKIDVIRHALKKSELHFKKKFDTVIDLDVSSPLRKNKDVEKSISLFKKKNPNNLITICKARKNPYFNMIQFKNNKYDYVKKIKKKILRRQDAPKVYEMNASIYIWNKKYLIKSSQLFSKNTVCYEMPYNRSIDIDSKDDLEIVKIFIKKK